MTRTVAGLALVLLGALPAAAATTTSIAALLGAPASYADQNVTIDGTVTAQSIGYAGQSIYTLQKDDHRITVVSKSVAPHPGDRLQVSGRVGYRPPDEEFTFPPIVLESDRQALP